MTRTSSCRPDIIAATAQYFRLSVDDRAASQSVATARQIAMYLCRERTNLSLKIGQLFGNRDHTTVMYACKKIAQRASLDLQPGLRDHDASVALAMTPCGATRATS